MIKYGRQDITQADINAVLDVLRSDWLTQGPMTPAFEQAVADYCNVNHSVAVNSATSALHIACLALGLGPGKRLWTSPNTFVASANCGLYCGADVDFVDIDFDTGNMSVSALQAKLEEGDKDGLLPDIVVPVHFAGQSCDMVAIRRLADRYGFRILADASHSMGGRYREDVIGSGKYADITVFSFHPVKIITTAEGGMATTDSEQLADRMRRLRSHGITRDIDKMEDVSDGSWYYQQVDLGFNYRMTEIQAALGLSQLGKLDDYVSARNRLAARYDELLANLPLHCPVVDAESLSAWHLYVVHVEPALRQKAFDLMRMAGIGVNVHYIPVHLQPYYQRRGFKRHMFPEAERHYAGALTIPLYPGLSNESQDFVVNKLRDILTKEGG
jgi:UDP-4-amino-4,6-dideoxy-N-acetyl-beta-L-altrosamine transaminase